MPAGQYYQPFEKVLNGNCEYEYFNSVENVFSNVPTRICHVKLGSKQGTEQDIVIMEFTIRFQSNEWKIHSEGAQRTDPGSVVSLRNAAVNLARDKGWKYMAIASVPVDTPSTEVISNYFVAIESRSYGNETVGVLTDAITAIETLNKPDFYKHQLETSLGKYTLAFIKRDKLIDYLIYCDDRSYLKDGATDSGLDLDSIMSLGQSFDLRNMFKEYILDVLHLKNIRQVNDLGNLSRMLLDAGVIEKDVYSIDDIDEYKKSVSLIKQSDEYKLDKASKKAKSPNSGLAYDQGMTNYESFLLYLSNKKQFAGIVYKTPVTTDKPRNLIVFGAPGTGKSFKLNQDRATLLGKDNEEDYERVTFHPDYSYANFVGTYKPVPLNDGTITYQYVPGPFMRVYVNAIRSARSASPKAHLLLIEEINRANVAAVFGDVFQLLDRDKDGVSEYPIETTEDMRNYLAKELGGNSDNYTKIRIPNNMFIWATMNSADQGVFPVDTAFKRRWTFEYIGIDDNDADIRGKKVILGVNPQQLVEWNKLRKAINSFLANQKINEDKQLGPYFISRNIVVPENGDFIERNQFIKVFKNKVLMYLFEDAAKQKRPVIFAGCGENTNRYSKICSEFDNKGINIFHSDIVNGSEAVPYVPSNDHDADTLEANLE